MKLTSALLPLLAGTFAAAQDYTPFQIVGLTTHQPNGYPGGQTNYYRIEFAVSSTNGPSDIDTGYCNTFWGDNSWTSSAAYSEAVPSGQTIQCDSSANSLGDRASQFSFVLSPYFSIGNFSFAVSQTFNESGSQVVATAQTHISNTTGAYQYNCTINPQEVPSSQVHASGDCEWPSSEAPLSLPVIANTVGPCASGGKTPIAFPVTHRTVWGESVYVVGSIPALGNWAPRKAVPLNADQYTDSYNLWNGTVAIAAGTSFEYKYMVRGTDGKRVWECCENRQYTVPSQSCGAAAAGNNPDYLRGT